MLPDWVWLGVWLFTFTLWVVTQSMAMRGWKKALAGWENASRGWMTTTNALDAAILFINRQQEHIKSLKEETGTQEAEDA